MKKFGFTLAELLVTVGIVGIIAAITVSQLNTMMPDKNKMKVLKAYKTITDVNNEIIRDPSLYVPCGFSIMRCTDLPLNPAKQNALYTRAGKYPYLFIDSLELTSDNINGNLVISPGISFTTKDGISWMIQLMTPVFNNLPLNAPGIYNITIDTDGLNTGNNCNFDTCAANVTPDRYVFTVNVDNAGQVTGNDRLTRAYLSNPNNLHDKRNDYARARQL